MISTYLSQKFKIVLSGIFLLLLLLLSGFLLYKTPQDFPPQSSTAPQTITVSSGESGSLIASNLEARGIVKSASYFISRLLRNTKSIGIAPGVHKIDGHIPSDQAIAELLDRSRLLDQVSIKEGSTFNDVLRVLKSDSSLIESGQLPNFNLPIPNSSNSLEGQLAPANYSFAPGTTLAEAIREGLKGFQSELVASGIARGYKNFTPYQLLIIASLLQEESDPKDYGRVAEVIYNRLRMGMPLQLNSTVAYVIHSQGQIGLSINATHVASPYNTYMHTGLPPTPICNPSLAALKATLAPEIGDWLYFITVSPGDTRFSNSFSQFESWVTLYNHNVSIGAFK